MVKQSNAFEQSQKPQSTHRIICLSKGNYYIFSDCHTEEFKKQILCILKYIMYIFIYVLCMLLCYNIYCSSE